MRITLYRYIGKRDSDKGTQSISKVSANGPLVDHALAALLPSLSLSLGLPPGSVLGAPVAAGHASDYPFPLPPYSRRQAVPSDQGSAASAGHA